MKLISSVECRNNGVLLQALSKEEVEHAIIKENSNRFWLAYTSPTLEDYLHCELGPSGEGPLSIDMHASQEQMQNRLKVKEIFE